MQVQLQLPNLGAVNRSRSPHLFLLPTPVRDADGTIVEILENPVGGPYGPLPSDPVWFPGNLNPRTAGCHILRGPAAARCVRAGGYF